MPCQEQLTTPSQVPVNHPEQISKPVWNPPCNHTNRLGVWYWHIKEQRASKQSSGTWPSPGEVSRAEGICSAAHSWEWVWRNTVNGAEIKPWRQLHRNDIKEGMECCKCDIEGYSETYKIGAGWKLKAEGAQTFKKMGIASIFKAVKRPRRKRLWQEP